VVETSAPLRALAIWRKNKKKAGRRNLEFLIRQPYEAALARWHCLHWQLLLHRHGIDYCDVLHMTSPHCDVGGPHFSKHLSRRGAEYSVR
jgi:hypothetical protein